LSRDEGLRKNPDGSVDLYVGPEAPAGYEKNWLQTNPGKAWFAYFRLYGPLEPYLSRSWKLPDFEDVAQTTGAKWDVSQFVRYWHLADIGWCTAHVPVEGPDRSAGANDPEYTEPAQRIDRYDAADQS
jgi:hypothetical protein